MDINLYTLNIKLLEYQLYLIKHTTWYRYRAYKVIIFYDTKIPLLGILALTFATKRRALFGIRYFFWIMREKSLPTVHGPERDTTLQNKLPLMFQSPNSLKAFLAEKCH